MMLVADSRERPVKCCKRSRIPRILLWNVLTANQKDTFSTKMQHVACSAVQYFGFDADLTCSVLLQLELVSFLFLSVAFQSGHTAVFDYFSCTNGTFDFGCEP